MQQLITSCVIRQTEFKLAHLIPITMRHTMKATFLSLNHKTIKRQWYFVINPKDTCKK